MAEPSNEGLDIIDEAFQAAAPAGVQAVSFVVPVHLQDFGLTQCGDRKHIALAYTLGSTIYVNVDWNHGEVRAQRPDLTRTIMVSSLVHEIAHAFTFLVEAAAGDGTDLDAWEHEVGEAARVLVDRHHLSAGLVSYWHSIHDSAVSARLAGPYQAVAGCVPSRPNYLQEGFPSPYGSTDAWEDIAEMARAVQAPESDRDQVCLLFSAQSTLRPDTGLLYTKALLLKHIGLVSAERHRTCTNGLTVGVESNGVFLGDPTGVALTDQVRAGYLDQDGVHFFAVLAQNGDYSTLLRILDPEHRPLGLHRLESIRTNNVGARNGFFVEHNRDLLRSRTSLAGLVFVTSATAARAEGIILSLSLQNGSGILTDYFWLSRFSWTP
ncbi:MAG: hypothetical protein ABUS79_00185 [Pseudomonadota bacterium]